MTTPSLLDDLRRHGTIRVGFQRHTPPFSYAPGAAFAPVGYSVDLARQVLAGVARRAGVELDIRAVEVTSSTRESLLASGEIDIECGSTTITDERRRRVAFSQPIFHTAHRIALKAGRRPDGGARVCITGITNSTSHEALRRAPGATSTFRFSGRASIGEAFEAFRDDPAIDGIVADEVILRALLRRTPSADATLLDEQLGGEHYGFMMRQGDAAFAEAVDRELDLVLGSPSFRTQFAAWFGSPLPGLGFELDMPMSGEMRRIARMPEGPGVVDSFTSAMKG